MKLQRVAFIISFFCIVSLIFIGTLEGTPAVLFILCILIFGGIHFFSMLTEAAKNQKYFWVVMIFIFNFIASFAYYAFVFKEDGNKT